MECGENIAFVFSRKLIAAVKTKIQRGAMRLEKHVRDNDLIGKIDMFSFVARIDMVADVKPWPAIESAGAHAADVIGRKIVADFVALVRAHPQLIRARAKCDSNSVANSPSVNLLSTAIRIELEDARAIRFRRII